MRKTYFLLVIICFGISSCSDDNATSDSVNISIEKPDFRALLFGNKEANQSKAMIPFMLLETESDIVDAVDGCYTVNVRVYLSLDNGPRYLVANDNVQVGDCPGASEKKSKSSCEGYLPDGNYVVENKTVDEICLYEVLTKNSEVYQLYQSTVKNTLDSLKQG
ncbi:MAG: hypothetical protein WBG71_06210 [Leeuwenhoekiella sp.]